MTPVFLARHAYTQAGTRHSPLNGERLSISATIISAYRTASATAYSGDVTGRFQRDVHGHSGQVNKVGAQRRWDYRLRATISDSVEPQHPWFCLSSLAFHFSKVRPGTCQSLVCSNVRHSSSTESIYRMQEVPGEAGDKLYPGCRSKM
jgi:hypothetical protein